jgi:hypothetical protein
MRPDSDDHYCLQWCERMRWVCVCNVTGRDCNWALARRLGRIVPGRAGSWGEYQQDLIPPPCFSITLLTLCVYVDSALTRPLNSKPLEYL